MSTLVMDRDALPGGVPLESPLAGALRALRRRGWPGLAVAVVVALCAAVFAYVLPPIYRSSAIILIEQQEIPRDLVRSTITSFADQRIQETQQRVMTSANLRGIIERYRLYGEELKASPFEIVLARMRREIALEMISAEVMDPVSGRPMEATIAFKLSYESESPVLAQRVANELTTLYLNENLKRRTELVEQTSTFLQDEAAKLEQQVAEFERRLADFKEANAGRLPEHGDLNATFLNKTETDIESKRRELGLANERLVYLQAQLAQIPSSAAGRTADGAPLLSPRERLRALESEYARLGARYAPDHPTLAAMRREIEGLGAGAEAGGAANDAARADLAAARERYAPDHPEVRRLERLVEGTASAPASGTTVPDNPAWVQLQSQAEAARLEIASLREAIAALEARRSDYESKLASAPQVEREYRALERDYTNAVAKFQEVRAKQLEAKLAESLESERKGERFTLIEPPQQPERPEKPNRRLILFMGLVLALLAGVAAIALLEALDGSVRGLRDVVALAGAAPLGVIPAITTADERLRRRRLVLWGGTLAAVLLIAALGWVHFAVKPLDVAWLLLLRRFGFDAG